jgi:hypothetical protein
LSDLNRSVAAFAVPLVVGRAVEMVLGTPWGKDLVESTGNGSLATSEGRRLVRRYSATAAAISLGAVVTIGRATGKPRPRVDRLETLQNLSELFLAAGALLKVFVDYTKDRREMERRMTHNV